MTEKIPFEADPLEPPRILRSRTSKIDLGDHLLIPKAQMMWTMQVVVREKDPDRELHAHFRVVELDQPTVDPPFESRIVPTGGVDPELRDLTFTVSTDTLAPGKCHQLELAVSGHFLRDAEDPTMDVSAPAFFKFVDPRFADDLDIAKWSVFEGKDTDTLAQDLAKTCNPKTDLITAPNVLMQ